MPFRLPKLPFEKSALAPAMSEETLEFHYGKHHRGYVEKLNKLLENSPLKSAPLEEIVRKSSGELFNNAAQSWNHTFFWYCMSAKSAVRRGSFTLEKAIEDAFEGKDKLLEKFVAKALDNFGSGWTWLVRDRDGKLKLVNTSNAATPITTDQIPLLVVDVWEHAYYIDFRNERKEYLEEFCKAINWTFVSERFDSEEVFDCSRLMRIRYAA